MDDLVFPDGVLALVELLHDQEYDGKILTAGPQIPADTYGTIQNTPFAHCLGQGGTTGYIDQSERVRIDIYAEAGTALGIAQSIKAQLHGRMDVITEEGVLDKIKAEQIPTSTPFSDRVDRAVLLFTVISRPKN